MPKTPNIDALKEKSNKLSALFNDPQPGLTTWHQCLAVAADDLETELRKLRIGKPECLKDT